MSCENKLSENGTRTHQFDVAKESEKWESKYGPGWKLIGTTDPCFIKS